MLRYFQKKMVMNKINGRKDKIAQDAMTIARDLQSLKILSIQNEKQAIRITYQRIARKLKIFSRRIEKYANETSQNPEFIQFANQTYTRIINKISLFFTENNRHAPKYLYGMLEKAHNTQNDYIVSRSVLKKIAPKPQVQIPPLERVIPVGEVKSSEGDIIILQSKVLSLHAKTLESNDSKEDPLTKLTNIADHIYLSHTQAIVKIMEFNKTAVAIDEKLIESFKTQLAYCRANNLIPTRSKLSDYLQMVEYLVCPELEKQYDDEDYFSSIASPRSPMSPSQHVPMSPTQFATSTPSPSVSQISMTNHSISESKRSEVDSRQQSPSSTVLSPIELLTKPNGFGKFNQIGSTDSFAVDSYPDEDFERQNRYVV